jgi:hypothetical protein
MKVIQPAALFIAFGLAFTGCSKDSDDGSRDCEENNITTVKFVNGGSATMRVQVAYQLTPQYEAIEPVVSLDLAPAQSVTKEIPAQRYMIVWKNGCPDNCNLASTYAKTYEACQEYTEQLTN